MIAGGHCAFNPEPMADFVDAFVIGDGEEAVGEITEVVGAWKRSGRTAPRGRAPRAGDDPGRVRARDVRRRVRRAVHPPKCARGSPTSPSGSTSAPSPTSREWPYPKQQLVPAHRGGARPPQRRGVPRLHARLPLLPGGHDHPSRCASGPREQVRTMVRDGLRRTGYDEVALTSLSTADFSGIDGLVAGSGQRAGGVRQRRPRRCRRCASTRSRSASPARSRRSAAPASRSRPRAARGGSAR